MLPALQCLYYSCFPFITVLKRTVTCFTFSCRSHLILIQCKSLHKLMLLELPSVKAVCTSFQDKPAGVNVGHDRYLTQTPAHANARHGQESVLGIELHKCDLWRNQNAVLNIEFSPFSFLYFFLFRTLKTIIVWLKRKDAQKDYRLWNAAWVWEKPDQKDLGIGNCYDNIQS